MSVLTGPNKGAMSYAPPRGADETMVQEIILAINRLDFPKHRVWFNNSNQRIYVENAFTVTGNAYARAMTVVDESISSIIEKVHKRSLAPQPVVFTHG